MDTASVLQNWLELCHSEGKIRCKNRVDRISLHVLPSDPLVVLDVWRKIKQQFEPHVRQLTLLWMPVNNFVIFQKTRDVMHTPFWLTGCLTFVFSTFLAPISTWPSEDMWLSGPWGTGSGGMVEKPGQSSSLAQNGTISLSVLFSTPAPTSQRTSPSLRCTMEVEVSLKSGFRELCHNSCPAQSHVPAQNPPQLRGGCVASQMVLPLTCPGTNRNWPLVVTQWSGVAWKAKFLVPCNGRRCQQEATCCLYLLVQFSYHPITGFF